MKRLGCVFMVVVASCVLSGCTKTCTHEYKETRHEVATCVSTGEIEYRCSKCNDTYIVEIDESNTHEAKEMTVVKEATFEEMGLAEGVCERCGKTFTTSTPRVGSSESDPYIIDSNSLWKKVKKQGGEAFRFRYLQVKGTVRSISNHEDMKGYYLQGGDGKGVVCWVNESEASLKKGDKATFIGKVRADNGTTIIELTDCTIVE